MQLNNMLKSFITTLSVIVVVSCSSNKRTGHDQSSEVIMANSGNLTSSNKISSEEELYSQMKQSKIIYFDLDKYEIRSEFSTMLDTHAYFLRNNPSCKVIVEGHTDERGTPEYNISLGERRANAVKIHLQGKGVSAEQISIVSYGKEKPAILGHNERAYAKNRRAILLY